MRMSKIRTLLFSTLYPSSARPLHGLFVETRLRELLSTGEVAVVLRVHAPDPHRPRVRVLFTADNRRLELPFERNLWELQPDYSETDLQSVTTPVDAADYNIDPLTFLETA